MYFGYIFVFVGMQGAHALFNAYGLVGFYGYGFNVAVNGKIINSLEIKFQMPATKNILTIM